MYLSYNLAPQEDRHSKERSKQRRNHKIGDRGHKKKERMVVGPQAKSCAQGRVGLNAPRI